MYFKIAELEIEIGDSGLNTKQQRLDT